MNELDWLTGGDPTAMLTYLESIPGNISDRKYRLYACACARRYWSLLRYPRPREAIEMAERFAEGRAEASELEETRQRADISAMDAPMFEAYAYLAAAATTAEIAQEAARTAQENARLMAVREAAWEVIPGQNEAQVTGEASALESRAQCELVRELFGNPFRPVVLNRYWMDYENGIVASMARQMYDNAQFDQLPYVADALTDAGCDQETLLRHLRTSTGHVRGCWALDLLIGLE